MDLLSITDEIKSHYVYIKDFKRFMCNTTKNNNKKHFCKYYLQCFNSKRVLVEHKENCLKINDKQSVKLKSCSIEYKNHFKQIDIPFKIYVDFECNLQGFKSNNKFMMHHILKSVKHIILAVLLTKLFVLIKNLVKTFFLTEERVHFIKLLKHFLKNMNITKK